MSLSTRYRARINMTGLNPYSTNSKYRMMRNSSNLATSSMGGFRETLDGSGHSILMSNKRGNIIEEDLMQQQNQYAPLLPIDSNNNQSSGSHRELRSLSRLATSRPYFNCNKMSSLLTATMDEPLVMLEQAGASHQNSSMDWINGVKESMYSLSFNNTTNNAQLKKNMTVYPQLAHSLEIGHINPPVDERRRSAFQGMQQDIRDEDNQLSVNYHTQDKIWSIFAREKGL